MASLADLIDTPAFNSFDSDPDSEAEIAS